MRRTLSIQLIFFKTQKYQIIYFQVMMKREKRYLKIIFFGGFFLKKHIFSMLTEKVKKMITI